MFLQFAQVDYTSLDLVALSEHAFRFFSAELRAQQQDADACSNSLLLTTRHLGSASFRVRARPATAEDQLGLDRAEAANQSHGMAALARRCRYVWEVTPAPGTPAAISYYFGALLASVALGPLVPADRSGLYGVRSARELSDRL